MRAARPRVLLAALLSTGGAFAPALAADGELDPGFHGDGRLVFHAVPGAYFAGYALAEAPDGRAVSAGSMAIGSGQSASWTGFGRTEVDFGSCQLEVDDASWSRYWAATFDPAGRLLVAGEVDFDGLRRGVLAAYLYPDCVLDPAFGPGGQGYVLAGGLGDYFFRDLVTLQVPRLVGGFLVLRTLIVGVGTLSYQSGPTFLQDVLLFGFRPDGQPDALFGDDGTAHHDLAPRDTGQELALAPGNRLVVLSHRHEDDVAALLWLDENGELVPVAGEHPGWRAIDLRGAFGDTDSASGLRITPAGRVLVSGDVWDSDADLTYGVAGRFTTPSLEPDPTFGGDGLAHVLCAPGVDTDFAALAVESDGRVVLAGSASLAPYQFCFARLTPAGALDPTFAGDGTTTVSADLGANNGTDHVRLTLAAGGRAVATSKGSTAAGGRVLAVGLTNDLIFRDGFTSGTTAAWSWRP